MLLSGNGLHLANSCHRELVATNQGKYDPAGDT